MPYNLEREIHWMKKELERMPVAYFTEHPDKLAQLQDIFDKMLELCDEMEAEINAI